MLSRVHFAEEYFLQFDVLYVRIRVQKGSSVGAVHAVDTSLPRETYQIRYWIWKAKSIMEKRRVKSSFPKGFISLWVCF
jgi:multidrug efflux pump subunit AcrA (membrane-fusion protein)